MPLPTVAALKLLPWRWIGGGVLALGLVIGIGVWYDNKLDAARDEGKAEVQAKWDAAIERGRKKLEADKARMRKVEQQYEDKILATERRLTQENADAKLEAERTISDLRANAVKLRDRFKCKAQPAQAAGSQETEGGLSVQDGEFLIREAARADQVVRELNAQIDYNEALYQACSTR